MKIIFLIFLFFSSASVANEHEDKVVAAMLERISQFISYKMDKEEFIICIYKDEELSETFKEIFHDRNYKGRPIKVKNIKRHSALEGCDIFYVKENSSHINSDFIKNSPKYTLLVTDTLSSLEDGFMLALYVEDKKMRFSINQKAVVDAKLNVNYRLLKVASKVINPIKAY